MKNLESKDEKTDYVMFIHHYRDKHEIGFTMMQESTIPMLVMERGQYLSAKIDKFHTSQITNCNDQQDVSLGECVNRLQDQDEKLALSACDKNIDGIADPSEMSLCKISRLVKISTDIYNLFAFGYKPLSNATGCFFPCNRYSFKTTRPFFS